MNYHYVSKTNEMKKCHFVISYFYVVYCRILLR